MDVETRNAIRQGREAFDRCEYGPALVQFRRVLDANPQFADVQHMAGLSLSFLGQPEEALAAFDRALALNDGYVEAHLHRAITLSELSRYEDAAKAFDEARACEEAKAGRFPASALARLANAHAVVGDLYIEVDAPAEASEQYQAAVELRPAFADIRVKLARAFMEMGNLTGAEEQLGIALDTNPNFLGARMDLGRVYYRKGDYERAGREWRRCREHAPDAPQLRAYLSMLEDAGVAADTSGDAASD